jgi:tetratricopeptide (TPR) repeat protein
LAAAAGSAWFAGFSFDEGSTLLTRALDETGPMPRIEGARILFNLASVAWARADNDGCERFAERSLELFEQAGDHATEARVTALILVQMATNRGDVAEARTRLEQVRAAYPPTVDHDWMGFYMQEAWIAGAEGDHPRAEELWEEIIRLDGPRLLLYLAEAAWNADDYGRARSATLEYLASDFGNKVVTRASGIALLATLALVEGNLDEAAIHIRESLESVRALAGIDPSAWHPLCEGFCNSALLAVLDGDNERAVRLLGARDAIRAPWTGTGSAKGIDEEYFDPARASLSPDVAARAKAEGATMPVQTAIDYTLDGLAKRAPEGNVEQAAEADLISR